MASNPHDQLFRKTFGVAENAAGELQAVLPSAIASRVDWSTLRREPGSFVDSPGRDLHTDLLFSAEIAGRRAHIYVLFEHQSTVDRWMPLRVLVYLGRIWVALREKGAARLPIIVPVVLHHCESGWTAARSLSELLDADDELLALARPFIPDFEMVLDDLREVPEAAILRRQMTALAKLAVWALRAVRVGFDESLLVEWVAVLEEARASAGPEAFAQFFVYLSEVEGGEAIFQAIDTIVSDELREVTMGLRKQWEDKARAEGLEQGREQGLEQGLEKGLEKGREQGRAETLLKLLRLRFGGVPDEVRERVQGASFEELDRWTERVLTADSLEGVLR